MDKDLRNSVVVITGASSGLGRVTAIEFAKRGARLALVARREDALEEVARICEREGSPDTMTAPVDVTDEAAVRDMAKAAHERFGRIDTWVNNASVGLWGEFEETPSEAFRRVIEINLFGYVNGTRAVLPYFREQGAGTIINVSSMLAAAPAPYLSPYLTSKFAVRGFSAALREELMGHNIDVCTILPPTMDTPLYQQGANYMGKSVKSPPPVYDPEKVAKSIISCAEKPRREALVGGATKISHIFHMIAPGMYERSASKSMRRMLFKDSPSDRTDGNLFNPLPQFASARGGWKGSEMSASTMRRSAKAAAAASAALGGVWALYRMRTDRR